MTEERLNWHLNGEHRPMYAYYDNVNFSGYIDFDLSQRNIKKFDLCYFMTGLLSEEEMFNILEERWFDILRDILLTPLKIQCFQGGYCV